MKKGLFSFIVKLRKGLSLNVLFVKCSYFPKCEFFLEVLICEGFVSSFKVYNRGGCNENKKYFIVFLKYIDNKSVISNIEVFLKKRNPFFISSESLWKVKSINNLYLLSTPKFGIVSDRVANFYNTGGEVLLKIV